MNDTGRLSARTAQMNPHKQHGMVLQIRTDAAPVSDDVDSGLLQGLGRTDARAQEQRRRVNATAAHHRFAGIDRRWAIGGGEFGTGHVGARKKESNGC